MNEDPFEGPVCFICDYGWIIGILIILGLALFFTRDYWLPYITG